MMTNAACIVESVDGFKTQESMKAMKAMKAMKGHEGHEGYEGYEGYGNMNATLLRSPMKAMNEPLLRSPMNTMNATSVALLRSPGEIIMSRSFKEKIQKGIRNQKACDEKDEYIVGILNEVSNEDFEESKRNAYECHK